MRWFSICLVQPQCTHSHPYRGALCRRNHSHGHGARIEHTENDVHLPVRDNIHTSCLHVLLVRDLVISARVWTHACGAQDHIS